MGNQNVSQNFFASGTALARMGQPTASVSPFYGRMGGGYGFFGGCGCTCGNISAELAANAMWREQNFWGPMQEIAKLTSNIPQTNSGASGTTSNVNTNNYADCFDTLNADKLHKLQEKEKEVDKLQEAFDNETDATKRTELAKQLKSAKNDLSKLEKSYFKGTLPSQTYAKENFKYSNISDNELEEIHTANTEINDMKKEADDLKQQLLKKQDELVRKREELIRRGGNPDDTKNELSKAEIQAIDDMQAKYNELMKEISDKIDQLDKNIKEAGSSADDTNFAVAEAERSSSAKKTNGTSKQVAEKMFDKDDKLLDRAKMEKVYTDNKSYKKENVDAVLDLIYDKSGCKTQMTKEEVKNILTDPEFLKAIRDSGNFDSKETNKNNVKLLQEVYDEIVGSGEFDKYLENNKSNSKYVGIVSDLKNALKKTPKPSETVQSKTDVDTHEDTNTGAVKNKNVDIEKISIAEEKLINACNPWSFGTDEGEFMSVLENLDDAEILALDKQLKSKKIHEGFREKPKNDGIMEMIDAEFSPKEPPDDKDYWTLSWDEKAYFQKERIAKLLADAEQ